MASCSQRTFLPWPSSISPCCLAARPAHYSTASPSQRWCCLWWASSSRWSLFSQVQPWKAARWWSTCPLVACPCRRLRAEWPGHALSCCFYERQTVCGSPDLPCDLNFHARVQIFSSAWHQALQVKLNYWTTLLATSHYSNQSSSWSRYSGKQLKVPLLFCLKLLYADYGLPRAISKV